MSRHLTVESTLRGFTWALSRAMVSEEVARKPGLLQLFDPRTRLIGMLALLVAVATVHRIVVVAVLFVVATAIALLSGVSVRTLALRVWIVVLGFTGLIALPALFTIPGNAIFRLGFLTVTEPGLRAAGLLILRVETAVTLTTVLVLSTPWTHVLKSLRSLGVPAEIIAMLTMTHRYIFLFIETAQQMFESRQSRIIGTLSSKTQRGLSVRTAGVLMNKSMELGNEVYLAMQSRGFRGEVQLVHEFRFRPIDVLGLVCMCGCAVIAIWMGR